MAEIIPCPECERSVSVPERLFGKIVRCPSCKATVRAEAPEEQEPEIVVVEEEPLRPRSPKPARRDPDEDEEEVPRRKPRADDEEEEAPRKRRRDDDEEDAKRPRRARS